MSHLTIFLICRSTKTSFIDGCEVFSKSFQSEYFRLCPKIIYFPRQRNVRTHLCAVRIDRVTRGLNRRFQSPLWNISRLNIRVLTWIKDFHIGPVEPRGPLSVFTPGLHPNDASVGEKDVFSILASEQRLTFHMLRILVQLEEAAEAGRVSSAGNMNVYKCQFDIILQNVHCYK